ncbi:uncharacterized protein LOC136087952 [Hydra vulgaris]|uniref:Uncharacterized protein LOC136087952 n=1 Tax=Hydra vulgaris TaxID=6087 RepID=A0ABM4D0B1_HYDVU
MHKLQIWILKEEKNAISAIVDEAKPSWIETNCSIMSEVKDAKLLFRLLDEVVEEVGEKNAIQVITDNALAYKAAGQMLMEKGKNLYWTPCAAHCFDLMFEDVLKLPLHPSVFHQSQENNKPYPRSCMGFSGGKKIYWWRFGQTRCYSICHCISYFSKLVWSKGWTFTSKKWKTSAYASCSFGENVPNIILKSKSFWPGVIYVLNTTKSLVIVLQMVGSEKYPSMGFIDEAMYRAKEKLLKI